ncbi:LysR family transcriptional regulator [Chitinibacter fontanus]|uniref:LysR family transcriptional regulator n=1 Tax=Chitinibacter fontanus TaxID=1737446 RepID=A0A7D5VA43_9NEIS|nr:LysR family transcriptional regulator [Chitinibacter fontanus]QLI81855.1 LysR family transcriptional regulator [Chitinibacter fontanus]
MLKLTLRELEIFVAICQASAVGAAGQKLGLSQSATSGALSELERRLGVQLFDRVGRGVVLNEQGRYLLPKAMDMLQQAQELEANFINGVTGRLRVAASLTIGNYVMPRLLERWLALAPQAQIELEIVNSRTVLRRLLDCRADLGFIEAPYSDPQLVTERWLNDELIVYTRADHPLVGQPTDLTALARSPWILREPGSGVRRMLESMLLPHLGSINVLLELGSGEAIREAVRGGLGIACASRRAIARELASGEFAILPTPGLNLMRQFHLVWHAERRLGGSADQLRSLCHQLLAEEQAGIPTSSNSATEKL